MDRKLRAALAFAIIAAGLALIFVISRETPVGALKGRVVAQETGNPLVASVSLTSGGEEDSEGTRIETRSAKDGSFSFPRVPAGWYTLAITSKAHAMDPVSIAIQESKTQTIEAELSPVPPNMSLYIHQHIFTPDEQPQITCRGFADSDALAIALYKVDTDAFLLKWGGNMERLLGIRSYYEESGTSTTANLNENGALTAVKSLLVPITTRDIEGIFIQRIDLPKLAPGLYIASAKVGDIQRIGWLMVTSLGLITKSAGMETLAYSVDLRSGAPVQADVTSYVGDQPVASGKTNDRGLLTLTLPSGTKHSERQTVVARRGDSLAFVTAWFSSTEASRRIIYAYTDRPVYRPGQKVYFKGIVRKSERSGYAVPSSLPVTVEVRDSRDTLIYRAVKRTDRFGSYFGSLDLNPEASTGYYSIVSNVEGERSEEGTSFQVAAYRKPEFSVKVGFPRKRYVRGDTVRAKVTATYYFGAPVANATVSYSIRRNSYWPYWEEDQFDESGDAGYSDYGGYGESVTEGTVRTDANGEATIEFAADWPQPEDENAWDTDQEFSVEAYVTDRANREANGTGTVLATRGRFALDVTPARYLVQPGEQIKVAIKAIDYDKNPVKRQRITVTAGRDIWTGNESRFEKIKEEHLVTDDAGNATWQLTTDKTGDIRITTESRDGKGNKIISSAYVWSYSGVYEYDEGIRYADLQIVTDKKTYKPGETARILINTKNPGGTALVTVEGERVYDRWTVPLKNRSTTIEIPVKSEYKPNFYVGVCFVKDKEFTSGEAGVRVSLTAQALQIEVKPGKAKYKPGETASYKIKATDSKGRPARAQISVGVVDEAIYAIAEDTTKPILDYFYARRPNNVSTNFSFPQIYLSDPDKAGKPLLAKELRNVRIRKRFLDTAYWNPAVLTDSNGEATVSFQLPDNLTTWRATLRGITVGTSCGDAKNTVIAQQDFLVRLEMPRFLVQTDEAKVSAVVHNYTGKDQSVRVDLRSAGLSVQGRPEQRVSVRNGGTARLDWNVRAPNPGEFEVTVRAGGDKVGDAMQLVLPVYPHGVERVTQTAGALSGTGAAKSNIEVRGDSIPGVTKLKIRLAPSLAAAMLGSLEYLAEYPWGCTEQTISSFLPDVILSRSFKELGLSNRKLEAELPDMVTKGLFRLYRLQLEDGGWSWCEYGGSDPWMTAYVCYGLVQARKAGFAVNDDILRKGLTRLRSQVAESDLDTSAYACYVLALAGESATQQLNRISSSGDLSPKTLAILALSYAQLGDAERAKSALKRLYDRAVLEPDAIHWKDRSGYYGEGIEATALALQATMKINPSDPRAYRIVRWLMMERQGGYWYSTRETAMVLYAMTEFAKVSKELTPDFTAVVLVNGKAVGARRFTKASIFEPEYEITITNRDLRKGRNSLEIRKTGVGSLYYTSQLTQYVAKDLAPLTLTGSGLNITRTYYKPPSRFYENASDKDLGAPVSGCRAGDVIFVRLVVNCTRDVRHCLVEDFIPAGCEIIDRGQVSPWEWSFWWVGQDVRDEKIAFYVDGFDAGKHVIEYQMRAGFAGSYHALPAQVFAMYEPTIRASTAEQEFTIR